MNLSTSKHTKAVLGIDLGTSGCKVTAVRVDGEFLHSASASYPTFCPQPAWAEQDPRDWLLAVTDATRRLLSQIRLTGHEPEIAGLALSSAAHIGVLLDGNNRPLRRAILWSDQRTTAEVQFLEDLCGPEILDRTYQKVSTTWTLPHLAAAQRTRGVEEENSCRSIQGFSAALAIRTLRDRSGHCRFCPAVRCG
ncbi:MAG: hypothetical protein FJW26_21540 [Acidimicrobiia bacterium]|nr:hypothetical protein [Acidimicrobiia bacterium]